jgi:hypothetical protein
MNVTRPFTAHPASVGESYGEHMGQALCFGGRMVLAGLACLIHGVLPFLFVRTGSRTIAELNDRMITRRAPLRPLPSNSRISA